MYNSIIFRSMMLWKLRIHNYCSKCREWIDEITYAINFIIKMAEEQEEF